MEESKAQKKAAFEASLKAFVAEHGSSFSVEAPEGYYQQGGDIMGFWASESMLPIHGFVRGAKLMDSKIEPERSAALVMMELVDPCIATDENGELFVAPTGAMIGVWYKSGMRAIRGLQNQKVWMRRTGETKDVGKASEMIVFDVRSAARSQEFFAILEDFRKDSVPEEAVNGELIGAHPLESTVRNGSSPGLPPKSPQPDGVDF